MRLLHALLLIPLLGAPAFAETTAPPAPTEHRARRSAEQHFADANTTRDGRLTLDQAATGYKSVAKAFAQIDVNHRGYVTFDDIKAWKAAKKAARQAAKQAAAAAAAGGGMMQPSPAMQRGTGPRPMGTSSGLIVPYGGTMPQMGVDVPRAPMRVNSPS